MNEWNRNTNEKAKEVHEIISVMMMNHVIRKTFFPFSLFDANNSHSLLRFITS